MELPATLGCLRSLIHGCAGRQCAQDRLHRNDLLPHRRGPAVRGGLRTRLRRHAGPSGPNFPAKIGYSSCMRNPRSRIGIVGAGHLGTSLARIFLSRGWSAEELLVAHRGSRASLEALEALNLADRSAPTPRVFESDVVFITVRPEDLAAFRGMEIPSRTILVSCLAGIPVATAQALLAHPVIRVLPSSPTSLEEGKGIAGVFPGNSGVETLVSSLGIVVHPLKDEEDFHSFTACLCLPARVDGVEPPGKRLLGGSTVRNPRPHSARVGRSAGLGPIGHACRPDSRGTARLRHPDGDAGRNHRGHGPGLGRPGSRSGGLVRFGRSPKPSAGVREPVQWSGSFPTLKSIAYLGF